jgi:hypothetical protein
MMMVRRSRMTTMTKKKGGMRRRRMMTTMKKKRGMRRRMWTVSTAKLSSVLLCS